MALVKRKRSKKRENHIGKCLLLENDKEKVLVIGDLHLGYEGSMRASGFFVPAQIYSRVKEDFDDVYSGLRLNEGEKLDKIIILGDVKHEFGEILREEWNEIENFLKYLRERCDELIVIEGNHDKILFPILKKIGILGSDFYLWNGYAFVHGDKSFDEIEAREVKTWVMGHGHPAVILKEGAKNEKYKCFLEGKFGRRRVIILPSFFPLNEGTDPRQREMKFAWDFDLKKFNVRIVGGGLEVYDFGRLGKIR